MKNIQKDLLAAFEQSGLTYDDLAKRTNLPKSALYRYLNGDTEKIPIDRFQAICSELHVDASSILGWKKAPDIDLNLRMFAGSEHTKEARIISGGIDKMPPDRREQALNLLKVAFAEYSDYFKEENDHDT